MPDKQRIDISVHTEEQVEQIFSQIESLCKGLQDHREIQQIINKRLGGRLILTLQFNSKSNPLTLYRVTPISDADWFQIGQKSTYSYPPNPDMGRANIKGIPVFYASLDIVTAMREMKNKLTPGSDFFVSEWKFIPKKTIHGHCLILNSITQSNTDQILYELANNHASQLDRLADGIPNDIGKGIAHAVRKMGDLFTIPGCFKYNITSSYAHDIIYEARKQKAYMPILIYPSVENNHEGVNFAIHPELIQDESVELQRVFKLSIPPELTVPFKEFDQLPIRERGIYKDATIEWQTFGLHCTIGSEENIAVKTDDGKFIRGEDVLGFKFINSKNTINDFIQWKLQNGYIPSQISLLAKEQVIQDGINYKEKAFEKIFIFNFIDEIIVETNLGQIKILNIEIPVIWLQGYRKKN